MNSAKIILYSVNFQEFKDHFDRDEWNWVADEITRIAQSLEEAGANAIILCSNTTHVVADKVIPRLRVPLLHIAEATGIRLKEEGIKRTALLGTQFTLESGYYQEKLGRLGIETLIPHKKDREYLNQNIFQELSNEFFTLEAREKYLEIIKDLVKQGAEAVIYGCTEIPILLEGYNLGVPSFDTLQIHVDYGISFSTGRD